VRSIACCLVTRVCARMYVRRSRALTQAYARQITGKWSEQQISLIYFNFSPAKRARAGRAVGADSPRSGELLPSYFRVGIDLRAAFGSTVRTLSSLKAARTWKCEGTRQNYPAIELNRRCFIADRAGRLFILRGGEIRTAMSIDGSIGQFTWPGISHSLLFLASHAGMVAKLPRVNSEAHITRQVTYPRQQGRPPAVPAADAALVVSLFATLIMESPLARGPCGFARRTRLRCYRLLAGLAAGRARATKLGEQPIRAYSTRQK